MLRWERWAGALCFVAACGGSEYDREWDDALARPGVGPHDLPHLQGRLEGAWVSVEPPDLFTSTGRGEIRINFGPGTSSVHDQLLAEPGRVWLSTYPDAEVVPTTRFGDPMSGSIVLTPMTPLEARWYAIRIEVGGPVLGTSFVDGVQMSRFRPDSYPVVEQVIAADRIGRRIVDLRFSENVATDTSCTDWAFTDDEGAMPCRCIGPSASERAHRIVWLCDRREVGAMHFDFGGVPENILGIPLRDLEGIELSAIDVAPTGVTYPGGGIQYR